MCAWSLLSSIDVRVVIAFPQEFQFVVCYYISYRQTIELSVFDILIVVCSYGEFRPYVMIFVVYDSL